MRYLEILSRLGALIPMGCGDFSGKIVSSPPPDSACPECDSDQDKIPDKDDACPNVFAATHDGCPPEAVTGPIDVLIPDAGAGATHDGGSQGGERDYFILDGGQEQPICPSLAGYKDGKIGIAWQAGPNIFKGNLTPANLLEGVQEIEVVGHNADPNFTQCNIHKAIAINEQGEVAVIWGELIEGNQILLNMAWRDQKWILTNFMLRHLGEKRRNYLASIMALPDGNFFVVWTDDDRVLGQKIDRQQGPLDRPQLISRKVEVLHVANPDIASADADNISIVWQEGSEPTGNIAQAMLHLETFQVNDNQILSEGNWPAITPHATGPAISWIDSFNIGRIWTKSASYTFGGRSASEFIFSPLFVPQLLSDEEENLFALWSNVLGRDVEIFSLAEIRSKTRENEGAHYLGQPVAEGILKSGAAFISIPGGLLLVYSPILIPKSLKIEKLGENWEGRDDG